METTYHDIEYGLYIVHPQNPNIVIFKSGNQYLFINGFLDSSHVVKLDTKSIFTFPTDNDMTMGMACIYRTNFKDIFYWEV